MFGLGFGWHIEFGLGFWLVYWASPGFGWCIRLVLVLVGTSSLGLVLVCISILVLVSVGISSLDLVLLVYLVWVWLSLVHRAGLGSGWHIWLVWDPVGISG